MKQIVLSLSFFCILFITTQEVFSFDRNKNIIEDILIQTNNFRKSKGLSKLVMRNDLNAIARQHSVDMAKGKVGFGHTGFGERNAMAKKRIKQMHAFAENVAYGAASGKEVVNMWEHSAGHRRNLLGQYKYIGIGIAKDKYGRIFYTQVFAE
ncbi:MAG TPA: CAP domain-containing protein [Hanamia sp.]|nr:CAP domain-containing protein [Hanamia sp.]